MKQIIRIKNKIELLKNSDSKFKLFGASKHKYSFNSKIDLEIVKEFESKYQIQLPDGYTEFLTTIGNGGAGPYYGLEPVENCLFSDLDYKDKNLLLNPGESFEHTESWNMNYNPINPDDDNEYRKFEEIYNNPKFMNGSISICNFGCGVMINLVVKGKEYGNIWADDRCSDNGIYSFYSLGKDKNNNFLDWYELWLDDSLKKLNIEYNKTSGNKV